MTVINPNSISGITSITLPSGGDNVLTIHTNDGTERFRIDSSGNVKVGSAATISPDGDVFFTGVCTATTLAGAASGLTGALPALDGSALTGVASTENIRTNTNATFLQNINVSGITTVGSAVTISESGIEASGIGITCASINGGAISGRRNIIINGDMQVAQRATSSTTSGYTTVDRWNNSYSADASMTFTQHALTSSDSGPYEEGFRYSNHVANGDTAAGGTQSLNWQQPIEAQNVSLSGWNYTSPSSFITLSFWAKSSVGQTFNMSVMTIDGTTKNFPFDVTLAENTWTKVIKTIPGNSGLQIDNDTGEGVRININVFTGTSYTDNSVTNDTWQNWSSSARFRDNTSTWFTTDGATFEYTGVQLEVGSQATPFEHHPYSEELFLCQRYYFKETAVSAYMAGYGNSPASYGLIQLSQPNSFRATPTITITGSQNASSVGSSAQSPFYSICYCNTTASSAPRLTGYEMSSEL